MPNAERRPDGEIHQEWADDTSANGKSSGNISLEVIFDEDTPDGQWTTHIFRSPDKRMNRGDKTAIVIGGLSEDRERELTALIHGTGTGSTPRAQILSLLAQDENLRWAA